LYAVDPPVRTAELVYFLRQRWRQHSARARRRDKLDDRLFSLSHGINAELAFPRDAKREERRLNGNILIQEGSLLRKNKDRVLQ
jgi:hypothetical protein